MKFTLINPLVFGLLATSTVVTSARRSHHHRNVDVDVEEEYDAGVHMPVTRSDPFERRGAEPLEQIASQVSHIASKYRHNFQAFAINENGRKNPSMSHKIGVDDIMTDLPGTTLDIDAVKPNSNSNTKRQATSGTSSLAPVTGYSFWKGTLSIGSPAQNVDVLWDTGSADFVLNTNQFDETKSTSARSTNRWFQIGYADGTGLEGTIYNETVSVVGKQGRNQAVGVPATGTFQSSDPGIVGLAWQSISVFKRRPLVPTLAAQGSIPRSMFGVALARDASKAEIRIGGYNPKKLAAGSSLAWTPVDNSGGFWVVPASKVVMQRVNSKGTKQSKLTNRSLIMDTGTSLIFAPTADVKALYESLDIRIVDTGSFITGVFRTNPTFTMTIGGKAWSINADSLTAYTDSTGLKYGSIVGSDDIGLAAGQWLVGDPFFSSVYSVFDMDRTRLGLASPSF
ncbi:unnamed protein product [Sympodiomycopsis kandeliae]